MELTVKLSLALSDSPAYCKANKKDEAWVKKHPKRGWCIRPFIEGEDGGLHNSPPTGMRAYTIVERLPSGGLMRRFIMSRSPLSQVKHSDSAIRAIFAAWFLGTPKDEMFSIGHAPKGSALAAQINAVATEHDPDDSELLTARVASLIDPWTASLGDLI
jgi:hypothetical protein